MTPNITAPSSAPPPPAPAHPQPKAGPAEKQINANAADNGRVPSTRASTTAAETPSRTTAAPNAQALTAAVEELNQHFQDLPNTHLQFSMDDQSGEMVVKVMDVEKEEVIRQIPPQEVLALAAFFKEQAEKEAQGMNLTASGASGFSTGSITPEGLLLHAKA
ncbi:MAG: flagellar protein FlaG [Candidatus Competibacteraceae bacterium]|nr:MAG: flagellar protein FlaG [Candidatus Competibacteraceae bacterium]